MTKHTAIDPEDLAELVAETRSEVSWSAQANRFWVIDPDIPLVLSFFDSEDDASEFVEQNGDLIDGLFVYDAEEGTIL